MSSEQSIKLPLRKKSVHCNAIEFASLPLAFSSLFILQLFFMNIYVANLNFDLRDGDLRELFLAYGEVSSARIIVDKISERSRGFGFVEMPDEAAGQKAVAELNGAMVGGRLLKVNEAKPSPDAIFNGREERNYNNSKSYNQTIY